ncbi:MAG: biosynthetic peptidoglycan transglycosylase, partial [Candidatus Daviesbacteria bacterium]|nr:biosynthetic peptidoglycan transglycosylase [Candidatus Daviesbacteria bacterium]
MKTLRRDLFVAFLATGTFVALIPILTYLYFAADLSPKESLVGHNDTGLQVSDTLNRPFFTFYQAKFKKEIPLSQVPKITQQAIISIEDKDFYSHPGFSIRAIIRSIREDIQGKSLSYGGSTITQQLIKNSLLNPKKNYLRKIQEIILAQEIERRYAKNEILEMYLNSVYFGEG